MYCVSLRVITRLTVAGSAEVTGTAPAQEGWQGVLLHQLYEAEKFKIIKYGVVSTEYKNKVH